MTFELRDRTVVLIGGAAGIGLAVARRVIADGARVVLGGRSQERLDSAVATLGPAATGPPSTPPIPMAWRPSSHRWSRSTPCSRRPRLTPSDPSSISASRRPAVPLSPSSGASTGSSRRLCRSSRPTRRWCSRRAPRACGHRGRRLRT
ncbi:SDR family NAD(P)-dependent oxidoreductase [Mycobacteroides abscessus subsp. abscessus]|nr:SDR family NAD(P)-dependent oxidoreductase [Mycobacteroides abscessus subsp. abscessus]